MLVGNSTVQTTAYKQWKLSAHLDWMSKCVPFTHAPQMLLLTLWSIKMQQNMCLQTKKVGSKFKKSCEVWVGCCACFSLSPWMYTSEPTVIFAGSVLAEVESVRATVLIQSLFWSPVFQLLFQLFSLGMSADISFATWKTTPLSQPVQFCLKFLFLRRELLTWDCFTFCLSQS